MSATPGSNWQLMLADLAIILFITTFSALAKGEGARAAPAARPVLAAPPPTAPTVAEPVALWRAGNGAPPLGEWLSDQPIDGRMRINVHGGYRAGRKDAVLADASAVMADPALSNRAVRLILEPAPVDAVTVTISFDY